VEAVTIRKSTGHSPPATSPVGVFTTDRVYSVSSPRNKHRDIEVH
jgi:hypothetical protein